MQEFDSGGQHLKGAAPSFPPTPYKSIGYSPFFVLYITIGDDNGSHSQHL